MLFLAAPMLAGLILASVPIIIHLWNKRRFRVIEWAPMKYLKLTIQTNRRRMRIEQLLLLAVRVLVVALLFIALARPALSRSASAHWHAVSSRASRFIVLDDSMSMGYQADGQSAFDQARAAATQILRSIGAQDGITVVLTSQPNRALLRESGVELPKILRQIENLTPTDASCDWVSVFKQIDAYITGAAHLQKELILITDLRRSGWSSAVSAQAARWRGPSFDLKIVDVGSRQTANTILARFEQEDSLALAGVPLRLRAQIRNDSGVTIRPSAASLDIDGESRPVTLPELPAGQAIQIPLTVTLAKPGQHVMKLSLPNDSLPADNTRWLAIGVRAEVRIAIIDGQLAGRPFESSTDFLQVALTAGADPWVVNRRADSQWQNPTTTDPFNQADVVVLSDVPVLSPRQAAVLETLVNAGAGLMIFAGDQVDPVVYNQLLYRQGAGLLPAQIGRADETAPNGLTIENFADSPLAPMAKLAPEALSRIRPKKFLALSLDERGKDHDSRILARWNDSEAHPAVIEKRFGRGRVILWTVSADRQWSDWPVDPTYVLAMRTAAAAIVRPEAAATNFTAGEPIAYPLAEGQFVQDPRISGPDRSMVQQPLSVVDHVLRLSSATRAGPYILSWRDQSTAPLSRTLCASFDPAESNLQPISESELSHLLSPLAPVFVHWGAAQPDEAQAQRGREVWRDLICAVLILAAVETVLAMWVGRER
jgi:hypothetical protein